MDTHFAHNEDQVGSLPTPTTKYSWAVLDSTLFDIHDIRYWWCERVFKQWLGWTSAHQKLNGISDEVLVMRGYTLIMATVGRIAPEKVG